MRQLGSVVGIWVETVGTSTAGASAGATVLPVENMAGFAEDGGTALVGEVELAYDAAVDDDAGDYLTLSAALDADVAAGTEVLVSPLVQHKTALVEVAPDEVYECDVPSGHLWSDSRLAETAEGGQSVWVEPTRNGQWEVVGIPESPPSHDAAFLTPSTFTPDKVDVDAWTGAGTTVDFLNRESDHHPDLTITGATIRSATPGSGSQVSELSSNGFSHVDTTGLPDFTASNEDGARVMLQGIIRALSLAVDTGAISQQLDLQPGSVLNWAQQFPAPQSGPTAVPYWESIPVPPLEFDEMVPSGLVRDSGSWWTATGPRSGSTTYLTRIDDDGTLTHVYVTPDTFPTGNGLTLIGSTWWFAGRSFTSAQIQLGSMSSTGVVANTFWTYTPLSSPSVPVLGTDGTNLLVADIDPVSSEVVVTRIDPADGSVVSVVTLPEIPISGQRQLAGIYFGSADFGEDCYVVWADFEDQRRALVCRDGHFGDWDSNRNFGFANDEATVAACWADDLARFASIGAVTPAIWLHADNTMDGLDLVCRFTQTWYNSHPYETTRALHNTRVKMIRRSGFRINSGTLPGAGGPTDPETARIYFTNNDGVALSNWSLEGTTDPTTGDLIIVSPLLGFEGLPAANTFPTGDYALITRDGTITALTPVGDGTYTGELIDFLSGLIGSSDIIGGTA